MTTENTAPQINAAILSVMKEVGAIAKTERNTQQGFDYRGIDQVYNRLHPLMVEHGIFTTSEIITSERFEKPTKAGGILHVAVMKMKYTFRAADGSSVDTEVVGEGMDSGDKASNKAMAIAHKYALCQAFMIPTQDMIDPDSESLGDETEEDATEIQMLKIQDYAEAKQIPAPILDWLEKRKYKLTEPKAAELLERLATENK